MKVYEGTNVRNVALVGHADAGKTSLAAALLFTAGATPQLGRVDNGTAPTEYDEEEVARAMSISNSLAFAEWNNKTKVNLIDTPGFNMFVHEAKMAMPAVESVIVVVDGVHGVEVCTEKTWQYAEEFEMPRMVIAARMDRERADPDRVLQSVHESFGREVIPVQLPIGREKSFNGIVDVVRMKAYTYDIGGSGKGREIPIPNDLAEPARAAHEAMVEIIAEGNDALMEEFFEKGTIPDEHLLPGTA